MTLAGGAIGLGAAVGLGQLAQSLLFQLKGSDPVVLVASAVALTLVALARRIHPRAPRVAGGSDDGAALRVIPTLNAELAEHAEKRFSRKKNSAGLAGSAFDNVVAGVCLSAYHALGSNPPRAR